jgi:hypothetical protein
MGAIACTIKGGKCLAYGGKPMNTLTSERLRTVDYQNVVLHDSPFKRQFAETSETYLAIPNERLVLEKERICRLRE